MRLTQNHVQILKNISEEVFSSKARLFLFGSRTDDQQRGGDIDLYVTGLMLNTEERLDAQLDFLVKAKQQLGDQRIDLIFEPRSDQPLLPIHLIAQQTGVLL